MEQNSYEGEILFITENIKHQQPNIEQASHDNPTKTHFYKMKYEGENEDVKVRFLNERYKPHKIPLTLEDLELPLVKY